MTKNLLLLDESPLIHRVVELTFEGQDIAVHTAGTPEEALSMAKTLSPAIVVASLDLPGTNSFDFCRRLREETSQEALPVLLLSSPRHNLTEQELSDIGSASLLPKPFEPDRLLSEVQHILTSGFPPPADAAEDLPGSDEEAFDIGDAQDQAAALVEADEEPAADYLLDPTQPGEAAAEDDLLKEAEDLLSDFDLEDMGTPQPSGIEESGFESEKSLAGPEPIPEEEPIAGEREEAPSEESLPEEAEPRPEDVDLFEDSELENLFAEPFGEENLETAAFEANEEPKAPLEETPAAQDELDTLGDDDLDLPDEEELSGGFEPPKVGLDDFGESQVSAAEAQLASLQEEIEQFPAREEEHPFEAGQPGDLSGQEEPDFDTLDMDEEEAFAGGHANEAPEHDAGEDADLSELAELAGFGASSGGPHSAEPSSDPAEEEELGEDLEIEEELAISGFSMEPSSPSPKPAGEAPPVFEPSFEEEAEAFLELEEATPPIPEPVPEAVAEAADEGKPDGLGEASVQASIEKSLEKTVEALVPSLLRHIEGTVLEKLPDLVETIVLREIEKIKRGE